MSEPTADDPGLPEPDTRIQAAAGMPSEAIQSARPPETTAPESPGLLRAVGPWMATAVVIGTIIGSGIFKKPQQIAENVPNFGLAATAWVLGGLLAVLGSLALAEVAVLYPRAGGNYVYLREAFGRWAGFLWGWVEFWIIRGGSLAALATLFAESLHDVLRNDAFRDLAGLPPAQTVLDYWGLRGLTVAVIMGLALVNVRGVRWGGGLQFFITVIKVGSLLAIMALPFVIGAFVSSAPPPQPEYLEPVWPASVGDIVWKGFGTALLGVLWAYHGWMNIAPLGGEVKRPQRDLPLAMLLGVAVIIFLYLGANLAYYLVVPRDEMAGLRDTTVATVFSMRLLGPIGAAAASAAVMCSVFGALNGNLLVGPRVLYAMGEDRLAPRILGEVHASYRTPAVAILLMGGWSSLLVLAVGALSHWEILDQKKDHFNRFTDFAMFGAVIFETLAVASIFVFRRRLPDLERPYRCPLYPWVPIIYVVILGLVLVNMFTAQLDEALVGLSFIGVGAVVYVLIDSGRRVAATESCNDLPASSSKA